jgi:hypothetical protein
MTGQGFPSKEKDSNCNAGVGGGAEFQVEDGIDLKVRLVEAERLFDRLEGDEEEGEGRIDEVMIQCDDESIR